MKRKPAPKPSTLLTQSLALLGTKGQYWAKGSERIEPGNEDDSGKEFPEGAYCSIGAIKHINTPNQDKAIAYLAFIIKIENSLNGYDNESAISDNNDDSGTKFSDVKRWFTKAIKIAKANGD